MKKYELNFYDKCGNTTTREEKIIIEADSLDEAKEKAYKLPQVRKYDNLIVGEYIDGMACYGVQIRGVEYYNGKASYSHKAEVCIWLNAKSEEEIRRYFRKEMAHKFSHRYTYDDNGKLYDECKKEGQDLMLAEIIKIYQIGKAIERFKTI
jgi:hypothetical protein